MKRLETLKKANIYNKYVTQLFTLYRLQKLKEEIDHNRSISSEK